MRMIYKISIIAIISMIAINAMALTPLDALKSAGKQEKTGKIDLIGSSCEVFNTSAFANDDVMNGKHFTDIDDAAAEALRAEQANKDWANSTTELYESVELGYGNKSPVELSNIVAPSTSVDEFVASLGRGE
jgi:hypothetical protein